MMRKEAGRAQAVNGTASMNVHVVINQKSAQNEAMNTLDKKVHGVQMRSGTMFDTFSFNGLGAGSCADADGRKNPFVYQRTKTALECESACTGDTACKAYAADPSTGSDGAPVSDGVCHLYGLTGIPTTDTSGTTCATLADTSGTCWKVFLGPSGAAVSGDITQVEAVPSNKPGLANLQCYVKITTTFQQDGNDNERCSNVDCSQDDEDTDGDACLCGKTQSACQTDALAAGKTGYDYDGEPTDGRRGCCVLEDYCASASSTYSTNWKRFKKAGV